MIPRFISVLTVAVVLATSAIAGQTAFAQAQATAPATATTTQAAAVVNTAAGTSCANTCQAEHDRCRVQTKGSASCDEARQNCLRACLQQKKR